MSPPPTVRDLSSPIGKVEVARARVTRLEELVRGYLESDPAEVEAVPSTDSGFLVAKVKGNPKPLPSELQGYVGDAIHNLRDALDHLACELVGSSVTEDTSFPITKKGGPPAIKKVEQSVRRRLRGASPDVIAAVLGMELFENGKGDGLWRLHQASIVDKHQRAVQAVFNQRSVIFDAAAPLRRVAKGAGHEFPADLRMPIGIRPADIIPLAAGSELFKAPPEWFEKDYQLGFAFELAFVGPSAVRGKPLVPTLNEWRNEVETTIRTLGAIP